MQQTSEKKKKREGAAKNPQVSVRLNVRPLRANWKPAKIYEPPPAPPRQNRVATPVEDQLDTSVWKSKHIRTDVIKAVELGKSPKRVPGLVGKCDCACCGRADDTQTVCEQGGAAKDEYLEEKKRRLQEAKKKRRHHKSQSNKKRRHRGATRTRSISSPPLPPPAPPNSFMSPDNQTLWCKLYEQTCPPPAKAIDLKMLRNLPGQIGMSELEPEDLEVTPDPPEFIPPRSPGLQIMKPPPVSPPSNIPELIHHQPALVTQPESRPDPNLIILPAPTDVHPPKSPVHHVIKQESMKDIPPGSPASPGAWSGSNSSLIFMPSSTQAPEHYAIPSVSNVLMFRKMEHIFYSSESNWWLLVALVMLTIFAYRSSMEQHTCYYD